MFPWMKMFNCCLLLGDLLLADKLLQLCCLTAAWSGRTSAGDRCACTAAMSPLVFLSPFKLQLCYVLFSIFLYFSFVLPFPRCFLFVPPLLFPSVVSFCLYACWYSGDAGGCSRTVLSHAAVTLQLDAYDLLSTSWNSSGYVPTFCACRFPPIPPVDFLLHQRCIASSTLPTVTAY